MNKRTSQLLALVGVGALALTACTSTGGSTTPEASPGEAVSSAAPPAEKVDLTFQSLSDQPGAIAATEAVVKKWNAENPMVQVKIVPAGWDGVYDKLVTQFAGGAAPDIIHYEAASVIPFALDGYLADMTPYISEDMKSDVNQGIWDSVTVNDQIIAVPTELQSYMVFANTKMLKSAGITVPTGDTLKWDDFRAMAKQATTGGQFGLGWGLKSPTATFMSLGLGNGGVYFDGEGDTAKVVIGDGELKLPNEIMAMNTEDKSLEPSTLTQSGGDVLAGFYAGKYAMTVQGSYQAANIAKDAPEGFEWAVLPALEGTKSAAQSANPQTLSVNIDSKSVEQSAAFVNYFASAENLAALNTADALIPASKAARDLIAEQTGGKDGWTEILASGDHLEAAPFMKVPNYTQWKDTVATPAFQTFLAGQSDADGLSKALTDGWTQINR
ncbi:ABC transporter substrate-binding protein [Tessaracoccus antarcticus]|uniref:Sugar ABC transporter substrate-binding protein n=1 Tax=Tessaracoccus antarcticus TaxID=2479848 RepID=A0A3M0GIC1_9ACTN|nr:sugar ABC transporter substrate-binding protein [Tessaracoccus antarcticus]RMB61363.1 sugar ABC transporter substrate-binding protein [Tessaracoccus antarcticus]